MTTEEAKKYLEIIVGDWSMEFVLGPIRTEKKLYAQIADTWLLHTAAIIAHGADS